MDERSVAAYQYDLPASLIAQTPASERDTARLMIVGVDGGIEHRVFRELAGILRPSDLLVLNETRVIRARLFAKRTSGGKAELLLLHPSGTLRYDANALTWTVLVRPAKRVHEGARLAIVADDGNTIAHAVVKRVYAEGARDVHFESDVPFETLLERAGRLPLPPYIHNESDTAQQAYQTVFARVPGSVAAPTAALHFTPELLVEVERAGVEITKLTLDVGLGTFRTMKTQRVDEHDMHAERYALSEDTVARVLRARDAGRRVVAVGTTVVRALEGNAAKHDRLTPGEFETSLFIMPGFAFRVVDAMITNFHLPGSTLLVLVSAFAGRERVLAAYREAIAREYRFFSFGDAMLLERPQRTEKRA